MEKTLAAKSYTTSTKTSSRTDTTEKPQLTTSSSQRTEKSTKSSETKVTMKLTHVSPDPGPDRFSSHHPMIPKRYVPAWQLDMKNRERIIENCQRANLKSWGGHVSYFLEGRERLNVTSYKHYDNLFTDGQDTYPMSSHLSKYNSSILYHS